MSSSSWAVALEAKDSCRIRCCCCYSWCGWSFRLIFVDEFQNIFDDIDFFFSNFDLGLFSRSAFDEFVFHRRPVTCTFQLRNKSLFNEQTKSSIERQKKIESWFDSRWMPKYVVEDWRHSRAERDDSTNIEIRRNVKKERFICLSIYFERSLLELKLTDWRIVSEENHWS